MATRYKLISLKDKASGSDINSGSDDAKFATAKAIKDSTNVPSVAPSTSGNVLTSNGTNWTSATPSSGGVDTSGTPADNDFAKFTDADTIEGRSYTEVKTDLSLNNVTNNAQLPIAGGTLTGAVVAADHGTGTTDQVVNVCYSTSATPPTASTTTEGALFVQYTA